MEDVDEVLTALTAEFFAAVSFKPGGKPDYDRIYGLFVDGGLLIKNAGETPEISTVRENWPGETSRPLSIRATVR